MRTLYAALACSSLVLASALAEEAGGPSKDPKANGQAVLEELEGFMEGMTGEHWFGTYLAQPKCVGMTHIVVSAAPENDKGAVYMVEVELSIDVGPFSATNKGVELLDENFGLVESEGDDHKKEQGKETKKHVKAWREGSKWIEETTIDGKTTKVELEGAGADHGGISSSLLYAKCLDFENAQPFELPAIEWPDAEKGETTAKWRTVTYTPKAAMHFDFRGEEIECYSLHFASKTSGSLAVTGENEVLAILPEDAPFRMFAGETKEDAGADLPADAAAAGPLEAVTTLFRVLAKTEEVDALDAVVDWEAAKADMESVDPTVKGKTAEQLAAEVKGSFEATPAPFSAEQVDTIAGALQVKVDGDNATVGVPGQRDAYRLKKGADGWRIVHFAQ